MRDPAEALALVRGFSPAPEDAKSQELILALLERTREPFSRRQFHPGHITCTALVLHPEGGRILLMYHHRHHAWLLPGGHVEESDLLLADAARREAIEETAVQIGGAPAELAGMDVHAIPEHKDEPYHLHHDLVFALRADSDGFTCTDEAPQVVWCAPDEFDRYAVKPNIRRAARLVLRPA